MEKPAFSDKLGIKKGPWTPEEDKILIIYIQKHGPGNWRSVPTKTGLIMRCSESCRLRWTNHLSLRETQHGRVLNKTLDKAIRCVSRAYELTKQLHSILELHPLLGNRGNEIGGLVQDLLQTLTASLSILRSGHDTDVGDRHGGSQELGSASSCNQRIESSGESAKFLDTTHNNRSRRETKSYYRCTHKDGQNCIATKQVQQRDSQDPPTFLITYLDHHTCSNTNTAAITPQLMVKSSPRNAEPFSLNLRLDSEATNQQEQHYLSSLAPEYIGDMISPRIGGTPSSSPTASLGGPMLDPLLSEIRERENFSESSSHGWVMDYMMKDSQRLASPGFGFEFEDVESFLNS